MQIALRSTTEEGRRVVRLSGSLGESGVPVLRDALRDGPGAAVLDLEELISVSAEGLAALAAAARDGVELRRASPYIQLRLATAADDDESRA